MQEIYSNGKENTKTNSNKLPWCSVKVDWPYEVVTAQAEVATSRQPNVFEWIVVRILQEFAGQPPTLAEAAEELGIKDPVFLTETLQGLIENGVVEKQNPDGGVDFSNYSLTSAGQMFLDQQKVNNLPERHGLELLFDAITTEHIVRQPANTFQLLQNPIIASDKLAARRTNIGLDTARRFARAQDEPYLSAQSKMTDIKVLYDLGSIIWLAREAALSIDSSGTLHCTLIGATEEQQQWLNRLDLTHNIFTELFATSIGQSYRDALPTKQFPQWHQATDDLIAPSLINKEAADVVTSAKEELFLNAYWLSIPEVRSKVLHAANRGVRCIIYGQVSQMADDLGDLAGSVEIIEQNESSQKTSKIVLAADGSRAVSIDRVQLHGTLKQQVEIIVASFLKKSDALRLQQELSAKPAGI